MSTGSTPFRVPPRISGAIAIVIGLIVLGIGVRQTLPTLDFVRRASAAEGRIVECGSTPVFAYSDADGATHRVRSGYGSEPPRYRLGDRVAVLYDPAEPARAEIDDYYTLWHGPTILLFVGTVGVIAGFITMLFGAWIKSRIPPEILARLEPPWRQPSS